MKKRILLIDESLTVQKVVALTLDRNRYNVAYAKSRNEAMKRISEELPDLILVSDQVTDLASASFPKEVETWLGRDHNLPAFLLVTAQDIKEARHYQGVLKKPFSPQVLQSLVTRYVREEAPAVQENAPSSAGDLPEDDFEDQRLQKIFNDTFNDEANLVRETMDAMDEETPAAPPSSPVRESAAPSRQTHKLEETAEAMWAAVPEAPLTNTPPADLWNSPGATPSRGPTPPRAKTPTAPLKAAAQPTIMGHEDSMAYKAALESRVEDRLENRDLDAVVDKILARMVPPIVERIVQERLDRLLKEHEEYVEAKP